MKLKKLTAMLLLALCLAGCTANRADNPETSEDPTPSNLGSQTGWQADGTYCLEDGTLAVGWINVDDVLRYFLEDGTPASGWVTIQGARCYFQEGGIPGEGWTEIGGEKYCLNGNGAPLTGWQDIDGKRYYFNNVGTMTTGWMELDQVRYYFGDDGVMATGPVTIGGVTEYFSSSGVYVPLVNPWRSLPEEYAANLLPIEDGHYVEATCYTALLKMLTACQEAGYKPQVCSAYRTQSRQEYLYQKKVDYYLEQDYEQEEAEELAATVVAKPGTSEHQLGLAVDIIDEDYPYLDDDQANTPAQQWLMEHCWEYGFILRYPEGTTDVTGIIYEPWHYRYVGVEIAQEIQSLGITLEEYLGFTHE